MMEKIRIGYFSHVEGFGGSELYLRNLIQHIDTNKYEVFFFHRSDYPKQEIFENDNFCKFILVDEQKNQKEVFLTPDRKFIASTNTNFLKTAWKKLSPSVFKLFVGNVKDILKFKKIFKEYNLDLFHFNEGDKEAIIGAYLAKVPIVIATYHGLFKPANSRTSKDALRFLLEKIAYKCLTIAIAPSEENKRYWSGLLTVNQFKFRKIYNGIKIPSAMFNDYILNVKKELKVDENTLIVGIASRLHPFKGHEYLIEAAPLILKKISNVIFLILGDGPIKNKVEKLVREKNLEKYIKFLGFRKDGIFFNFVFDVAVLPSWWCEVLPFSILEAMGCKIPVVASNFSGIPEVVEDGVTGILVPPKDPEKLADAIVKLLTDNDLRKKMGEAGRKRVEKMFTQERMLKETFGLYEELLSNRRNNLKIAIVSSGLEHIKRGVETWAKDLGEALHEKGIKVRLYKGSNSNGKENNWEKNLPCLRRDSKVTKALTKYLPAASWRIGLGSTYAIEQTTFSISLFFETMFKKYDIIHTQDPNIADILNTANKFHLTKSKVILAHGTEEPLDFISRFKYLQHLAPYHLEEAKAGLHNGDKWFAIPNFVDINKFRPAEKVKLREKFGFKEDDFIVLSVAAIKRSHKRIDYLIQEFSKIKRKNVFLLVVGSKTDDTVYLEKLGKDLLGEKARFLTNVPHENIQEIYAFSDLFTLCSLKEMMPISLLEALSSGLPCICHKYPVHEWIIGAGGECIDMTKEGELASTIEKYFDDNYRNKIRNKAREQAVNNFSKDKVIDQAIEMYEAVLNDK